MGLLRKLAEGSAGVLLSRGTLAFLRFDLMRARARLKQRRAAGKPPAADRLHFGCGSTRIPGWLNVDVAGSEQDVDLASGSLPWPDASFEAAMSQHVIEHLELKTQLMPLLRELRRVLRPGGEIWLSCPDLEKVCRSYVERGMEDLIRDREERSKRLWTKPWSLDGEVGESGVPASHMANSLFHQGFEHRNLFDFELLRWTLERCGFAEVRRVDEGELRQRFPEVPERGDDLQSLYVIAKAPAA